LYSLNDTGVGSTAAEVFIHALDNILARGIEIFQEQAVGRQDHPRGAETALQGIVLHEGGLERMNWLWVNPARKQI
jgi:hypothetical protein